MSKQTEALKMAIEALEKAEEVDWDLSSLHVLNILQVIKACKEALAQPAQEPVAIVYSMQDGYIGQMVVKDIPHKTKLYTHPAPSWQGLSDDEAIKIYISDPAIASYDDPQLIKYAHAIEQELKEKNTP